MFSLHTFPSKKRNSDMKLRKDIFEIRVVSGRKVMWNKMLKLLSGLPGF